MAINIRRPKLVNFSDKHAELFPLAQPAKKYPKELAVFQNIFWKLTHETPLKDDILKLLFFFSPKIRLTENKDISEQKTFTITAKEYSELTGLKPKSCCHGSRHRAGGDAHLRRYAGNRHRPFGTNFGF